MARPTTTLAAINSLLGNWDQTVDDNNDTLRTLLFTEPFPMVTVHSAAASEGSVPLSNFAATSFAFCTAMLVDAATPATNGYLIYSDGTNWKYQRTDTNV